MARAAYGALKRHFSQVPFLSKHVNGSWCASHLVTLKVFCGTVA